MDQGQDVSAGASRRADLMQQIVPTPVMVAFLRRFFDGPRKLMDIVDEDARTRQLPWVGRTRIDGGLMTEIVMWYGIARGQLWLRAVVSTWRSANGGIGDTAELTDIGRAALVPAEDAG